MGCMATTWQRKPQPRHMRGGLSKGSALLLLHGAPQLGTLPLGPRNPLFSPLMGAEPGTSACPLSAPAGSGAPLSRDLTNQAALLTLLQTVSPRDDHMWCPSCCLSCPSAPLAPCLLLQREPLLARAGAPAKPRGCARSCARALVSAQGTSAGRWMHQEGADHQWWDFICSLHFLVMTI